MIIYDPPSGWLHGFPRSYKPQPGESLAATLIRDGYPAKDADWASHHTSFSGSQEELDALTFPEEEKECRKNLTEDQLNSLKLALHFIAKVKDEIKRQEYGEAQGHASDATGEIENVLYEDE